MTLITVAANRDFIVQLSDRRLTTPTGAVFTEDETKVVYVETPTFQWVMGYTGLATIDRQPTNQVLMELLGQALEVAKLEANATVEEFRRLLSVTWTEWRVRRVGPANTRLSIVITGFQLQGNNAYSGPYQCLITNFQEWGVRDNKLPWDEFRTLYINPQGEWPHLIQRIGAWQALPLDEADELRQLLAQGIPPTAVKDSMLNLLPSQSAAYPTVGTRANVVILRPYAAPEGGYYSFDGVAAIQDFDRVVAEAPKKIFMISRASIAKAPGTKPFITEVPRRQPCACGSGLQFRRCHGKRPPQTLGFSFTAR